MRKIAGLNLIWMIIAFWTMLGTGTGYEQRTHGMVITENNVFTEAAGQLANPNRGFYVMYGFIPEDEEQGFERLVTERIQKDNNMLVMVQINLRNYTEGPISEPGLKNIEDIFKALKGLNKQYIVRFLYDWNGRNAETEPENVEIILNHMRQLEYIFREYSDIIFVQQGLFIGNWGEMNGTKHLESMQELALQLARVTDEKTYLAVRMPAQWRKITELEALNVEAAGGMNEKESLAYRLSLFNDGIMGNEGDYGTYGTKSRSEAGIYSTWNRKEELEFQDELCRLVPNGGEVILENPVNDFENAMQSLKTMHITYLNSDYDRNVLNKWAESVVTEEGVFNGMDGLTYVERHLGYRLLIADATLEYEFWQDKLSVELKLKNVGFAPMYKEPEKYLVVKCVATGELMSYPVMAELRSLAGGNDSEELLAVTQKVSLAGFSAGEYEVYFLVKDNDSGCYIELANEQEMTELGYRVGSFTVEELINPLTGEKLEPGSSIGEALKDMLDKRQEEGNVQ